MRSPCWAVFLSGRGSNAEALWEHLAELDVRLCVSSKKNAYGILRARRSGVSTFVLEKNVDWQELDRELCKRKVDRIFLLGFMKIIPAGFVEKWQGRMWNLHPSLLPDFPGVDSIEKSYEAGGAMGVSIHEVTAEMDAGPLCLQKKIADQVRSQMSLEEAQFRISLTEQRLVRSWAQVRNQGWI